MIGSAHGHREAFEPLGLTAIATSNLKPSTRADSLASWSFMPLLCQDYWRIGCSSCAPLSLPYFVWSRQTHTVGDWAGEWSRIHPDSTRVSERMNLLKTYSALRGLRIFSIAFGRASSSPRNRHLLLSRLMAVSGAIRLSASLPSWSLTTFDRSSSWSKPPCDAKRTGEFDFKVGCLSYSLTIIAQASLSPERKRAQVGYSVK
ncbi:hypothetical protein CRENBAI_018294 [Crenichthys baileyi]|uniref:Uncharacterized protein n=1 Tax=Crenichthys baileyi TaxID=28760 RepID=A0AAV9RQL9_9TELE